MMRSCSQWLFQLLFPRNSVQIDNPRTYSNLISVMEAAQSSKHILTPVASHYAPSSIFLSSTHQRAPLRYPVSAGSYPCVGLPVCTNHKRKKAQYVVDLSDGQSIHFCQLCMQVAGRQGFKGRKILEFHGITGEGLLNALDQKIKENTKANILHKYLDELKQFYQEIGGLKEKLEAAVNMVSNLDEFQNVLERLEEGIRKLRQNYQVQIEIRNQEASKVCQELSCKADWIQDDLEHIVSRVCKNYDRLLSQPELTFNINLNLMREALIEQSQHLRKLQTQYSEMLTNKQASRQQISFLYFRNLRKLWDQCLLDCSLSQINLKEITDRQTYPQLGRIIEDISTYQSLE